MLAFQQTKSTCEQVIIESFCLIGYYLKHNLAGVAVILVDPNNFQYIYSAVNDAMRTECLQYISWSLYILCLKYFTPGSESSAQLPTVQAIVAKLVEILVRQDC